MAASALVQMANLCQGRSWTDWFFGKTTVDHGMALIKQKFIMTPP